MLPFNLTSFNAVRKDEVCKGHNNESEYISYTEQEKFVDTREFVAYLNKEVAKTSPENVKLCPCTQFRYSAVHKYSSVEESRILGFLNSKLKPDYKKQVDIDGSGSIDFLEMKIFTERTIKSAAAKAESQKLEDGSKRVELFLEALADKNIGKSAHVHKNVTHLSEADLNKLFITDQPPATEKPKTAPYKTPAKPKPKAPSKPTPPHVQAEATPAPTLSVNTEIKKHKTEPWEWLFPTAGYTNVDAFIHKWAKLIAADQSITTDTNAYIARTKKELAELNPLYKTDILAGNLPAEATHLHMVSSIRIKKKH